MATYELNFRDYLRILQKRYWILILSTLAATVGVVIYYSFQTPFYQAVVTLRIEERKTLVGSILDRPIYYASGYTDYLASEIRVIQSRPIAEETVRRLGLIKSAMSAEDIEAIIVDIQGSISAERLKDTDLVRVAVTSREANMAAKIANTVAQVYQEENLKQKNKEARVSREFIEKQLAQAEEKLKTAEDILKVFREQKTASGIGVALSAKLADLQTQSAQLMTKATDKHPDVLRLKEEIANIEQQLKSLPEDELEFVRLTRDVEVNDKLYRMLRDRLAEAKITEAEKVSDATIINPAGESGSLVGPDRRRSVVLGFLMGLVVGFILILIIENLDTSIGTIEDVEAFIKLPVLGIIPSLRMEPEKKGTHKPGDTNAELSKDRPNIIFTICSDPSSPFAESFRILRTNLKIERQLKKVLLVTSTGPREGKTTVLAGLGIALAQMGLKTLLIDTDLRRPSVSKIFGLEREPGFNELVVGGVRDLNMIVKNFTDFLMGKLGFDYVSHLPGLETLHIITSGALTANASEILSSSSMERIIKELKERFDVILFDSPPALSITDASVLSRHVDSVAIVYEVGRTSRDALLRTKIQLESVGAKIAGVVLNHTKSQTEFQTSYYPYYKSYKYKYYYTPEEESKKAGKESAHT